jgi:hypothetical protein
VKKVKKVNITQSIYTEFKNEDCIISLGRDKNSNQIWIKTDKNGISTLIEGDVFTHEGNTFESIISKSIYYRLNLANAVGVLSNPQQLILEAEKHLKRCLYYNDVSKYRFSAHYAFCSWLYDLHDDVCNIAFVGLSGSGKSKALNEHFRISYNSLMASGSDSESSLLRSIEQSNGAICIDESQKDFSDSDSLLHRIFTMGAHKNGAITINQPKGTTKGEWEPRSFKVFSPKYLAGRYLPFDQAISRRTVEFTMNGPPEGLKGIPNEPIIDSELDNLKNNLLIYRHFRKLNLIDPPGKKYVELLKNFFNITGPEFQKFKWLALECPDQETFDVIINQLCESRETDSLRGQFNFSTIIVSALDKIFNDPNHRGVILIRDVQKQIEDDGFKKFSPQAIAGELRNFGFLTKRTNKGTAIECNKTLLLESKKALSINDPS